MKHIRPRGRTGFTLIELLVVIIAILATMLLPALVRAKAKTMDMCLDRSTVI